jgi:adenylate cyclase
MALENLKAMDEKADKMRVRTLLEQYLAPEVAEMLLARGEDLLDVGEIRKVTILFADIRNFTPLVRQIPLKTIRAFLNDFFGLFSEVIFKYKGTMDKFLGDAVLAFFGYPAPISEPEFLSVDSAILMQKAFEELKELWAGENEALRQIGLGIGISSGEVFLGNVGSKRRFDYTVIGTEVNISQRLSSQAASGEILVTERALEKISSRFRIIKKSSLLLKGWDKPTSVLSVGRQQ